MFELFWTARLLEELYGKKYIFFQSVYMIQLSIISVRSLYIFSQFKYSLLHCLLAPVGQRSGQSMKLMFFFCTSCCGLNMSVLSWPDHLTHCFLIRFPHFLVKGGALSLALTEIGFAVRFLFCFVLFPHCLLSLYIFVTVLVAHSFFSLLLKCQAPVKNLDGMFPWLLSQCFEVKQLD